MLKNYVSISKGPEDRAMIEEDVNLLKNILDDLKPREKELVIRKYFYIQSSKVIAQEMNMEVTTVDSYLSRLRKKMKKEFQSREKKVMSNPIIENAIFESKLIDLFSKIDISEVETDYPDEDIEKLKFEETLLEKWWNNKKVRRVTEVGVLASLTTGIIVAIRVIHKKRKAA